MILKSFSGAEECRWQTAACFARTAKCSGDTGATGHYAAGGTDRMAKAARRTPDACLPKIGRGLAQSKTAKRLMAAYEPREASWTAPVLCRFSTERPSISADDALHFLNFDVAPGKISPKLLPRAASVDSLD